MSTILFMVSLALVLSVGFVICYLWALSKGQFDDLETPALRMLKEDNSQLQIRDLTKTNDDIITKNYKIKNKNKKGLTT